MIIDKPRVSGNTALTFFFLIHLISDCSVQFCLESWTENGNHSFEGVLSLQSSILWLSIFYHMPFLVLHSISQYKVYSSYTVPSNLAPFPLFLRRWRKINPLHEDWRGFKFVFCSRTIHSRSFSLMMKLFGLWFLCELSRKLTGN